MEFHGSIFVGPKTNVHRIDERYAWVLERGISPKIQEGRFLEIEVVGFKRLPTSVSCS